MMYHPRPDLPSDLPILCGSFPLLVAPPRPEAILTAAEGALPSGVLPRCCHTPHTSYAPPPCPTPMPHTCSAHANFAEQLAAAGELQRLLQAAGTDAALKSSLQMLLGGSSAWDVEPVAVALRAESWQRVP